MRAKKGCEGGRISSRLGGLRLGLSRLLGHWNGIDMGPLSGSLKDQVLVESRGSWCEFVFIFSNFKSSIAVLIIVFRPVLWPVQFKARILSFDRVIWVNYLKKKKEEAKVNRLQPGFFFPCFFFNPARFQPRVGRVPGQPAVSGRILKLWF
jgi:hypothetical protein